MSNLHARKTAAEVSIPVQFGTQKRTYPSLYLLLRCTDTIVFNGKIPANMFIARAN